MTSANGRLSRWSRRKMKARRGRPEADPEEAAEQQKEPAKVEEPEVKMSPEEEAEVLRKLDLPSPEALQAGDDFSGFLKKGVPDQIRRRALRLLWRSNPILANVDGLVDYGEDFTDAATVVENLQTVFVVGHGARPIEPEEQDPAQVSDADAESPPEAPVEPEGSGPPAETAEQDETNASTAEGALGSAEAANLRDPAFSPSAGLATVEADAALDPPRRASIRRGMAFRFDD